PQNDPGLDFKTKREFFMNIRQIFGRTALLLSGGSTLCLNHIGTEDELPMIFDASRFSHAKTHQLYIDGSVENDLPMNKLSELFNVNHFTICQLNPHVIPFLQRTNTASKAIQMTNFSMPLAETEIQHRFAQVLSNPTEKLIGDAIQRAERATWSNKFLNKPIY
ncbi:hypothetical protein CU098_000701, partial [Rhizopus stolonifer]